MVRFIKRNDYQTRSKTVNLNIPNVSGAAASTSTSKQNPIGESSSEVTSQKNQLLLKIRLTSSLKNIIMEDDKMMKQKFIGRVPVPYPLDRIVEEFSSTVSEDNDDQKTNSTILFSQENLSPLNLIKTVETLVKMFNIFFPKIILYKLEEAQFQEIINHRKSKNDSQTSMQIDVKPSQFYGIIHFIRFLTLLPSLLKKIEMTCDELEVTDKLIAERQERISAFSSLYQSICEILEQES